MVLSTILVTVRSFVFGFKPPTGTFASAITFPIFNVNKLPGIMFKRSTLNALPLAFA